MRVPATPLVAGVALLVGVVLAVGYALFAGLRVEPPFGGSPTAAASLPISSNGPGASASASGSPEQDAVLVGAGDVASCDRFQDEASADAIERIPGTVFTLGDNVYPEATTKLFDDCYTPSWGRPDIIGRTRPTVGGNEYKVPGAADYFKYFGDAAGDPKTGWYAYNAGAWRVYVLNSQCQQIGGCGANSPQEIWLLGDLAAHPAKCVLAMWHSPMFSSGRPGPVDLMRTMWQTLQDAGAELVLSGNDHAYERFAPQDADGKADPKGGLVQIVVGTGGASQSSLDRTPIANSVIRSETPVFGVLRLDLAPTSWKFTFISTGGRDFEDSGSGTCH